jgi:hypothetical protein
MKYPPDSPDFLSADGLSWGGALPFGPRKSALVGRRDVIFLLRDESLPSTCAEPGISVENNRCAALMAKLLAKAALAVQRTP